MKWITREKVKVDRVACPWLIRKFIDSQAEFLFVPEDNVMAVAAGRCHSVRYQRSGVRPPRKGVFLRRAREEAPPRPRSGDRPPSEDRQWGRHRQLALESAGGGPA